MTFLLETDAGSSWSFWWHGIRVWHCLMIIMARYVSVNAYWRFVDESRAWIIRQFSIKYCQAQWRLSEGKQVFLTEIPWKIYFFCCLPYRQSVFNDVCNIRIRNPPLFLPRWRFMLVCLHAVNEENFWRYFLVKVEIFSVKFLPVFLDDKVKQRTCERNRITGHLLPWIKLMQMFHFCFEEKQSYPFW